MPNPLAKFGVSDAELAAEIAKSAEVQAGLRDECEAMVEYWREISPVDHGDYAASIEVLEVSGGKAKVGTTHWKAHMIEFGTKADPPGTHSMFGRDTPTPAFACGQQTAEHFGGDLTGDGIEL